MMHRLLLALSSTLLTAAAIAAAPLPSSFDLRDIDGRSYIGPVRDQGQCGSCYSFGALAAAESTWNRTHGLYDEQTLDLSEAFMVWSLSPLYDGIDGCDGANLDDPMTAMLEHGVPLEVDFPYTISDPGEDLHWDAPRYTFHEWYIIAKNDVETTRRVLHAIGAVTVAAYSGRDDWYLYSDGIFDDSYHAPGLILDHAISLVGWNDAPGDGGMGYWILRNSWGDTWGEEGYMRIRYTASGTNHEGTYLVAEPWSGDSIRRVNEDRVDAVAWSAGGTRNAHGIDLWGGAASSVINRGTIRAEAVSEEELATARGVYLWGGPDGYVVNEERIQSTAFSRTNQAYAYAVCLQGGGVDNRKQMTAEAESGSDIAIAYGVWGANGGSELAIRNSGEISARAGNQYSGACGIWSDNRALTRVENSGIISARAEYAAQGVRFERGPGQLVNSGTIQATASANLSSADSGGYGVLAFDQTLIVNRGTIGGSSGSVFGGRGSRVTLNLATGSDLVGPVMLKGSDDTLLLTGAGSENEVFHDVESLLMDGLDWSLSGDSALDTIDIFQGRFSAEGRLSGDTTVHRRGVLGGTGTIVGHVASSGITAPGRSVGHLTIEGDFDQDADGLLAIEVGRNTADLLTVAGNARLSGTLSILPAGYTGGGTFHFLEAGDILGAFDRVESVAVLDAAISAESSNSLAVEVARNSYAGLSSLHNRGLADNLDGLRPTAAGDFGDLLDRLDLAADQNKLNADMASLTPRIHGLAGAATLDAGQDRLADLRRHLDKTKTMAGGNPEGATRLWADVPAEYTRHHATGGYFRARENLYGLMIGAERISAEGFALGMAAAVTESDYKSRDTGDRGDSSSRHGYLYGSWQHPTESGGLHLSAALGAGRTEFTADRAIAFAGRSAHSAHDGSSYGATLQGRYRLQLGGWRLGPALGISYAQLREDGFEESGADSANLKIKSRRNDSLQGLLGSTFARPMTLAGLPVEPELRLEWRHEFENTGEALETRLLGGGDYFATPGRDSADDRILLGLAVTARLSDSAYGVFGYELELQDHDGSTGHALRLQAVVAF